MDITATCALLAAHCKDARRATVKAALCFSCAQGEAPQGKRGPAYSWISWSCWLRYFQVRSLVWTTDVSLEHAAKTSFGTRCERRRRELYDLCLEQV